MLISDITAMQFPIALIEPFTISRASVSSSRAALVRVTATGGDRTVVGLGEAALPLGDRQTPADLVAAIEAAAPQLKGRTLDSIDAIDAAIASFEGPSAARSGLHCALVDGFARLEGQPLYRLLGADAPAEMITDITLPIADPAHLAELAAGYWKRGFRCFKIKVGADLASDIEVVRLVAKATPNATLLFDANGGYSAEQALELLSRTAALGMAVTCFEQPCAPADLDGMRQLKERGGGVPVVADEAVKSEDDVDRLVAAGATDGVNLKLIKMGGIDRALSIGRHAQQRGLRLMVGAMIESRLGLTAMAHAVAALGGVEWVDLDTAFLLSHDPYQGGMRADGASLSLVAGEAGLGMTLVES